MGKSSTHKLVGEIAKNLNHLPRTGKEIAQQIDRDTQSVKEYLNQLTNLPNVEKKVVGDNWYYYRTDNKRAYLLEELADLEHRQWMHWSQYVAEEYDIPQELRDKWSENWIPYSELSEEIKDKDRKWAREALEIFEDEVSFGETDK